MVVQTRPANIVKFFLRCAKLLDLSRFAFWVSSEVSHNVREMKLNLKNQERFILPTSLYSLWTLEIVQVYSDCALSVLPRRLYFPSVKILHLLLWQPSNKLIENLFSRYLSFEHLSLIVYLKSKDPSSSLIIFSATLNKLVLVITKCSHAAGPNEHNVTIKAPSLEFIDTNDEMLVSYVVDELQSIQKSIIKVSHLLWSIIYPTHVVELVTDVSHTRFLQLSTSVIEVSCANCTVWFRLLSCCHVPCIQSGMDAIVVHSHDHGFQ